MKIIPRFKEYRVERVRKEFAQLGHICDVVRVTGYSRTLVKCVVNNHFEMIPADFKDHILGNTCSMDCPIREPVNMENFGELQYIIDKLPTQERFVLEQYFVHNWTKKRIADQLGKTRKVVDRILRNLHKLKKELK